MLVAGRSEICGRLDKVDIQGKVNQTSYWLEVKGIPTLLFQILVDNINEDVKCEEKPDVKIRDQSDVVTAA
jgi:hypothetical protein